MRRPDINEVYRYLGYGAAAPDARVIETVEKYTELLLAEAKQRYTFARSDTTVSESAVTLASVRLESASLAEHLRGSSSAFILAATLGTGVDRLIRRLSVDDTSGALIVHAAAAATVEALCDEAEEAMRAEIPSGLTLLPRFSPGYGDLPLEYQPELIRLTDAYKKIGLSCSDSYTLTPIKSVTAIVGIAPRKDTAGSGGGCRTARGCDICDKTDCEFRRKA